MICGLLFFATTINYIDRQVLSLLKPVLEKELGWNESQYAWIVFGFQLS
jgi:ACS family hexuronate transporter-like MFS transporter